MRFALVVVVLGMAGCPDPESMSQDSPLREGRGGAVPPPPGAAAVNLPPREDDVLGVVRICRPATPTTPGQPPVCAEAVYTANDPSGEVRTNLIALVESQKARYGPGSQKEQGGDAAGEVRIGDGWRCGFDGEEGGGQQYVVMGNMMTCVRR